MKRLIKIIAICLALPICAFAIWFATLLWKSPDYVATSTCTVADIDRTYAALEREYDFDKAVATRVWYERTTFHKNVRTLQGNFEGIANRFAFGHWDRRNTVAFYCDHAYVRLGTERPVTHLPMAASQLRHDARDDDEAWSLAVYLSHSGSSHRLSNGYSSDIWQLRKLCDVRRAARIKRKT